MHAWISTQAKLDVGISIHAAESSEKEGTAARERCSLANVLTAAAPPSNPSAACSRASLYKQHLLTFRRGTHTAGRQAAHTHAAAAVRPRACTYTREAAEIDERHTRTRRPPPGCAEERHVHRFAAPSITSPAHMRDHVMFIINRDHSSSSTALPAMGW